MDTAARYHPLAWTAAVAVCVTGWAAHFDLQDFSGAAAIVFAIALVAWTAVKWVARLKRPAPAGSLALAAQLQISSFALVAFGLYAIVAHALGLVFVYLEPTKNRAYAESAGFEFGPYMLLSLAIGVLVGILAFVAIRALRTADPARKGWIWLCCVVAPAAWLVVATGLRELVAGLKEQWGADLPSSTLFMIGFVDYRIIPVVLAFGLLGLAWFWRSRVELFRWMVVAQLLVALSGSAFFTFAISSAASMLFSMCGGPI